MKKIMIALAIFGMAYSGAQAQTKACTCPKKTKDTKVVYVKHRPRESDKSVKTYQVCQEHGGYYTCCIHKKTTTTKSVKDK
jgi:hypothetical protein